MLKVIKLWEEVLYVQINAQNMVDVLEQESATVSVSVNLIILEETVISNGMIKNSTFL